MSYVYKTGITDTLESNYMPYAMSVIVSRAIPEIDGFKPSHRKLLYMMYKMKLLSGVRTKSANVAGQTMKLNPHGEQSIYATMVRLTRGHDALLHPYVDSKGNFGKVTSRDMMPAASRYTEVKLDSICNEIFKDIDKDTVEFIDNYDGTLKEPRLLPTTYPNILVNPNKGIAVGMASNICSFNLAEVCSATAKYIMDSDIDLLSIIKAPDFSTGGILLYSKEQMKKIYDTGVGSFKVRAKWHYNKADNCVEITEIPYTTTIEQIIDKIVELVKANKIKEISDIRDETDLSGLKITLDLKRGTDYEKLMLKLFKFTSLEDTFSCNFNLLINGRPQTLGIKGILNNWIEFRIDCIKRQLKYDIANIDEKLYLLRGLEKVLLDIDRAIDIIRNTEKDSLVILNLMGAFEIEKRQAEYVADIKLRNINKEYIINKTKEINSLEDAKNDMISILNSDLKIKSRIVEELENVAKKYSKERKTVIKAADDIKIHTQEEHIEDYNLKVFLTEHNYFKKISLVSLRASGEHKLKDDDKIVQEIDGSNKDDILFFTDRCNVYKMKLYEMDDHKASSLGSYLPNILDMEDGENVLCAVITSDYSGHMLFAFENGKLAKVPMKSYETKTNRKKLVKAYSDHSHLVGQLFIDEPKDIMIFREYVEEVRACLLSTDLVPEKSTKNTRGVQAFRIRKGSVMARVIFAEDAMLNEVERFRINKLPMSGEALDVFEVIDYRTK